MGMQRMSCRRDVSFYGNKLFQSTFIAIIAPGASIQMGLLWTLLNSFVALVRAPLFGRQPHCFLTMPLHTEFCQSKRHTAHPSTTSV